MTSVEITGHVEIDRVLSNLPDALQRKVMISAFRKAARPMVAEMKRRAPMGNKSYRDYKGALHMPGHLKKSHGIVNGKSKDYPTIYVGPRYGKKYKYDGFYFKFLIEGTDRAVAKQIKKPLDNWIEAGARATEAQVTATIRTEVARALDRKMQSLIRRSGGTIRIAA